MTPNQLKQLSIKQLIIAYKNKARCFYCKSKAESIYRELETRVGKDKLQALKIETWHIQNSESDAMFDDECDRLLNVL